jgi:hypothetical protein
MPVASFLLYKIYERIVHPFAKNWIDPAYVSRSASRSVNLLYVNR